MPSSAGITRVSAVAVQSDSDHDALEATTAARPSPKPPLSTQDRSSVLFVFLITGGVIKKGRKRKKAFLVLEAMVKRLEWLLAEPKGLGSIPALSLRFGVLRLLMVAGLNDKLSTCKKLSSVSGLR